MKVLVAVKAVHDPAQPVLWLEGGPRWPETPLMLNPFDAIALEAAVQWQEAGRVSEVVTVSLGGEESEEVLRTTLALGAQRAVRIPCPPLSPLERAKVLAGVVAEEAAGLVMLGKQGVDADLAQTGPMLAGRLGWAQATFVSRLTWQDDQTLLAWREVDGGLEQNLLPLPAVITVDLRLNTPRYASLPNILKAKKKPLQVRERPLPPAPAMTTLAMGPAALRPAKGVRLASVAELAVVLKDWVR